MLRLMAAVQSIAGEHQALIDDIMEQCDKVSRMPLAVRNPFGIIRSAWKCIEMSGIM